MIESEDTAPEPEFTDEDHGLSSDGDPAPSAIEPDEEAVTPPPVSDKPWVDAMIADLDAKTVDELHEVAKGRGLSGYSSLSKDDLVGEIADDYRENPPPEPRIG